MFTIRKKIRLIEIAGRGPRLGRAEHHGAGQPDDTLAP